MNDKTRKPPLAVVLIGLIYIVALGPVAWVIGLLYFGGIEEVAQRLSVPSVALLAIPALCAVLIFLLIKLVRRVISN